MAPIKKTQRKIRDLKPREDIKGGKLPKKISDTGPSITQNIK